MDTCWECVQCSSQYMNALSHMDLYNFELSRKKQTIL